MKVHLSNISDQTGEEYWNLDYNMIVKHIYDLSSDSEIDV